MKPTLDFEPAALRYDDRGLVPCVAQDIRSGAVLMVAWADRPALEATRETGLAHFFSRSRQRQWQKGETSGNVLRVRDVRVDCDRDTLVLRVDPAGPACHTGARTCFDPYEPALELGWLARVLEARGKAPSAESYTARLLEAGVPRIAQKVGEEAVETVIAALGEGDDFADEAADLLYHLLVLCQAKGVPLERIATVLRRRHVEVAS